MRTCFTIFAICFFQFVIFTKSAAAQFSIELTAPKSGRFAISFVSKELKRPSLWIIDFDRKKYYRPTDSGFDLNGESPSWSPDGKSLLFSTQLKDSKNIYAWDAGVTRSLTSTPGMDDDDARYSPGGTLITFLRKRPGKHRSLWIMNQYGDSQDETYAPAAEIYSPRISPSLGEILLITDSDWPGKDLLIIPLKDGKPRMLTFGPTNYTRPSWHPSGKSFALTVGTGQELDIGVMNYSNQEYSPDQVEFLTREPGAERNPEWDDSGDSLFYIKQESEDSSEIWSVDVESKKKQLILSADGVIREFAWTKMPGEKQSVPEKVINFK